MYESLAEYEQDVRVSGDALLGAELDANRHVLGSCGELTLAYEYLSDEEEEAQMPKRKHLGRFERVSDEIEIEEAGQLAGITFRRRRSRQTRRRRLLQLCVVFLLTLEDLVNDISGLVLVLVRGAQILNENDGLFQVHVHVLIRVDRVLQVQAAQVETRLELHVKDGDAGHVRMLERENGLETVDAETVLSGLLKGLGESEQRDVDTGTRNIGPTTCHDGRRLTIRLDNGLKDDLLTSPSSTNSIIDHHTTTGHLGLLMVLLLLLHLLRLLLVLVLRHLYLMVLGLLLLLLHLLLIVDGCGGLGGVLLGHFL